MYLWSRKVAVDPRHHEGTSIIMRWRECGHCHAWLPLGPARDDERTAVEVRAAELAHGNEADFTACEWMGWNGDEVYSSGGSYHAIDKLPLRNLREWHAGYLAHAIATHKEPTP